MKLLKNAAQEEAINTLKGPVLLISCPGSGKTTTLVRRIHNLIQHGVPANKILMVTFTRDAAKGMAEKYAKMYSDKAGVTFATIHSLCFNILKIEGLAANDDVIQEDKKLEFMAGFLRSRGFYRDAWEMACAAATAISVCKNNYQKPSEVDAVGISADVLKMVYDAYENWKTDEGLIDYDDMLTLCLHALQNDEERLSRYQKRFAFIQCDEYQDTNFIQRDILYLLSADNHNLCVVGDDDQSIYGFRGAKPEIMLSFQRDFPNAKVIRMGINYRSGGLVVNMAGQLIARNKSRFEKELFSSRGEDGFAGKVNIKKFENRQAEMKKLVDEIKRSHMNGVPYNEMAVLFRTNIQAQHPVLALSKAEIPYYSTETVKSIYESFIFDDFKTYVKLGCGLGGQREMLSILNHPNRYFKEAVFRKASYTSKSLMAAAKESTAGAEHWKVKKAREAIEDWMTAFGAGAISMNDAPKDVFRRLMYMDYEKYIESYAKLRNYDAEDLMAIYDELRKDAGNYPTLSEWFDAADKYIAKLHQEMRKKDKDGVVITTMHRAKGLEWKKVWIIDADEGLCPHKKCCSDPASLEEERRLFYVAMTRAKDDLCIMHSGWPSRFLEEFDKNKRGNITSKKIPKHLAGHGVTHSQFGDGYVVRYEPGRIIIKFPKKGEKTFQFPEGFQKGWLKYKV